MFALAFVALLPCREYASSPWPTGSVGVVHPQLIDFKDVLHKSLLLFAREHLGINEALELRHHAAFTLASGVVSSEACAHIAAALTYHRSVTNDLEVGSSDEERIGSCIRFLRLILHREVVYGVALLPRLRIDALLFMIDNVAVYYQNSSLTVIVLVCLCYVKFFVHESDFRNLINALAAPARGRDLKVLRPRACCTLHAERIQKEVAALSVLLA